MKRKRRHSVFASVSRIKSFRSLQSGTNNEKKEELSTLLILETCSSREGSILNVAFGYRFTSYTILQLVPQKLYVSLSRAVFPTEDRREDACYWCAIDRNSWLIAFMTSSRIVELARAASEIHKRSLNAASKSWLLTLDRACHQLTIGVNHPSVAASAYNAM